MHIKVCRKEVKETRYWLMLLDVPNTSEVQRERDLLIGESWELISILGGIVRKWEWPAGSNYDDIRSAKFGCRYGYEI